VLDVVLRSGISGEARAQPNRKWRGGDVNLSRKSPPAA
jgi:hypothetical protein